jgi:hypothetical protein
MQGSSIVLYLPTFTATLAAGSTMTVADEAFGVPVSGGFVEHRSSTLTLIPVDGGDPGEATTLLQDGQKLVASATKDGIIVQQGTSTVTLAAGQETTFNEHTLSAAKSGSALIVDGSVMTITPTERPAGSLQGVETASDDRSAKSADAAGTTDTVDVITISPSTTQGSGSPDNAALGSMANTSLFLRLLCLVSFLWAGVGLV